MSLLNRTRGRTKKSRFGPVRLGAAVAASTAILLAGCGGDASSVDNTSAVEAGASKDDYVAALADIDPVELKVQVLSPQGGGYAKVWEDYGALLSEWSGGKITVKMFYSGSITATDIPQALADGLIDMAPLQLAADQSNWPLFSWLSNWTYLGPNNPTTGLLQGYGTFLEMGYSDEILDEYDRNGLVALAPITRAAVPGIMCGDTTVSSPENMAGKSVFAGTKTSASEVTALGGSPVSMAYTELFQGLQRGTVDCTASSLLSVAPLQLSGVTKYWTIPDMASFAGSVESAAIGKRTWEKLPLAARQLIWDTVPNLIDSYFQNNMFGGAVAALELGDEAGAQIANLDDDSVAILEGLHAEKEAAAASTAPSGIDGAAELEELKSLSDKWEGIVAKAGYPDDVSWEDFATWAETHTIDTAVVTDELADRLAELRPTK